MIDSTWGGIPSWETIDVAAERFAWGQTGAGDEEIRWMWRKMDGMDPLRIDGGETQSQDAVAGAHEPGRLLEEMMVPSSWPSSLAGVPR